MADRVRHEEEGFLLVVKQRMEPVVQPQDGRGEEDTQLRNVLPHLRHVLPNRISYLSVFAEERGVSTEREGGRCCGSFPLPGCGSV